MVRRSEVVDEERSILSCCSHSCGDILNSDWMAITALANHMCNFWCKKHVHLRSVLHGVNSMYRMMVDSNWMGIVMVTVEDETCKPRTASRCVNWNLT